MRSSNALNFDLDLAAADADEVGMGALAVARGGRGASSVKSMGALLDLPAAKGTHALTSMSLSSLSELILVKVVDVRTLTGCALSRQGAALPQQCVYYLFHSVSSTVSSTSVGDGSVLSLCRNQGHYIHALVKTIVFKNSSRGLAMSAKTHTRHIEHARRNESTLSNRG